VRPRDHASKALAQRDVSKQSTGWQRWGSAVSSPSEVRAEPRPQTHFRAFSGQK